MPSPTDAPNPFSDASDISENKKLVLIDGNSLLYRGFFAMRALTTSAGQPTNAVFSFTMMLLTLLTEQKPDVILCAWDAPARTFRHEAFTEYKGTRKATPIELVEQGPLAREMVAAFQIPTVEVPGFEADDAIGTLARRGRDSGYDVLIVTGDLDALQLVEPGVRVMTTVKGVTDTVIYDEAAVWNRYGLRPDQLADYRALKGDTSDNIPGVPGIGEKTAATLLQKYETVENLLRHLDEVTPAKLQASLVGGTDQMTLSKRLAVIVRDVPLEGVDLPGLDADPHAPDWAAVRALFERLEFRTMLKRIPGESPRRPLPALPESGQPLPPVDRGQEPDAGGGRDIEAEDYDPFAVSEEEEASAVSSAPAAPADYREADTPEMLAEMVKAARGAHRIGLRLHAGEGILDSDLLGVTLAVGAGTVFYVPVQVKMPLEATATSEAEAKGKPAAAAPLTATASLFDAPAGEPTTVAARLGGEPVIVAAPLKDLLEDAGIAKVTHEAKSDIAVLARYGVTLRGITFDTELASYLLNAGRRSGFPLSEIAFDYVGRELTVLDKKERKAMEADALLAHEKQEALKEADALLAIQAVQEPRLAADGLLNLLETLELPVAPILAEMELAGLYVEVPVLNRIAREMQAKIDVLETQIFEIAGGEFSIGSTKQLQEILFDKLKLPASKKTKTGYSTGAEVLEELAPDFPIVSLILSHRELTKLKNTYAEAMPALVRPDTHRIHTSLNQTVAATGRLSSSNPNLQNIPVRTEIGREIRRAFTASPGNTLVSADYSQIELRLFAHVSKDPELVAAFSSGEDIHKYTASRIYGVPVDEVTGDMRRASKTVNYAVIYGISEFALGRRLGISMSAAKELKTSYFTRFPGVRRYLDETVAFAKEHGYVQTLFGRRRYIPDINSRVFQFRQAAERAAANMPIQGSSADIMKVAMIRVYEMLRKEKFHAKMLLQVHDELLFETTEDEVRPLADKVYEAMSGAYPLDVALDVEVKTGKSWADVTPVEDLSASLTDISVP
ncbi:MAG: DNA polymerase I [Cytophagales bacterium]|nr:DNA polymerase I [Armatimonadota bacterium]